jgi:DNA-binding transcriptional MerR regulator
LRFVVNCRALGMSQEEIRELLRLRAKPESNCADVNAAIDVHIHSVTKRIADLNRLLRDLTGLRRMCNQSQAVEHCKILSSLDRRGNARGRGDPSCVPTRPRQ